MSSDTLLLDLHTRHNALQNQLTQMQMQHNTLDALHSQQCLILMEESMKGLFEVIICVRKADKKMVDWHHRSDSLKVALRYLGLDRRTATVIDKKTKKLKVKVAVVESKFDSANSAVVQGLRATENVKSDFVHFSQHSVEQISKETIAARNDLDNSHKSFEHQIERQRVEQTTAQNRIHETSQSLARARTGRENADTAFGVLGTGSILSFGVAALSAVLCPPSLLLTGSALAAGAGAGALACVAREDALHLEAEQNRLTASLTSHEGAIKTLELELLCLDGHRSECADAIKLVESLQIKTSGFRAIVQENLNHIRETKLRLDKSRLKLAEIIRKLHECQYEETRSCIAIRLREVLTMIQAIPKKKMTRIKPEHINRAMQYLTDIDKNTREVLRIAALARSL